MTFQQKLYTLLLSVAIFSTTAHNATTVQFGHLLLPQFMLDSNYINLNHGSYGSPARIVLDAKREHNDYRELNPDRWFRYEIYDALNKVRANVATYIGAFINDVVFIENASHGINAILRSIVPTMPQKKIMYLNIAYPMVKHCLTYVHETFGNDLIEVIIEGEALSDHNVLLDQVKVALERNKGEVGILVFSHITSVPAIILPADQLTTLAHEYGAMVLVDGAHALGQIPVDMEQSKFDFWLGNGHKWLYSPKGSALLYVRKDHQSLVRPTVISYLGQGATEFQKWFAWQGTNDFSSYLAIQAALDFRASFGDSEIMEYMHDLAVKGGDELVQIWGTEKLVPDELIGAMVNVRVPSNNATLMAQLPKDLLDRYNIYVPIYYLSNPAGYWVRVSAQIYNDIDDFNKYGNAVKELIEESKGLTTLT